MSRAVTEEQKARARNRTRIWKKKFPYRARAWCQSESGKKSKAKADRKYRNTLRVLKSRYGLSPEEFLDRLIGQGGQCKICLGPPVRDKRLSVDHDHKTGKVRGLLCIRCNAMLGNAKDNPEILRKAAEYLAEQSDATKSL